MTWGPPRRGYLTPGETIRRNTVIPARYANLLFSFLLSGMMSLLITGLTVLRTQGLSAGLLEAWFWGWLNGWAAAFPLVLVLAPATRRVVRALTDAPA
jgi:hypothetical protein